VIEEYRLAPDSGGPGQWRGGLGGERIFSVVADVTVSALLNRMKADPWGVLEGGNGAHGGLWVKLAGSDEWKTFVEAFHTKSPSKFSGILLRPGDQVKIVMPGGGGYGPASDRDPAMIQADIDNGFVTPERARSDYGYVGTNGARS
jgi:N-methylhydantoinase B/oxoprolinase/acetone carboxylase alpha subunit